MSSALILTGAPGTGKSSVLAALSTLLELEHVGFGAVETEELARGWPSLQSEQWIPQLEALVRLQRTAGRNTFLVVATTESEAELGAVIEAVGAQRVLVVCLSAAPDLAASRVAEREPDSWPGKPALVEHARKLASEIPRLRGLDVILPTDSRDAVAVAQELRRLLMEAGVLGASGHRDVDRERERRHLRGSNW